MNQMTSGYRAYVYRCPKCGKEYKRISARPYERDNLYNFGPMIFVTCPTCGAEFRDQDSYELAIMDPPSEMLTKFHVGSILGALLMVCVGLAALFTNAVSFTGQIVFFCFFAAGIVLLADYIRYTNNKARIEKGRAESRERLKSNPDYVKRLQAAGISIPGEFLPTEERLRQNV
ncbi:MAG: hypothetical protein IKN04_00200 [Clostridia bacterium]|nr:hypothetical protein [Clostridia bacterium]